MNSTWQIANNCYALSSRQLKTSCQYYKNGNPVLSMFVSHLVCNFVLLQLLSRNFLCHVCTVWQLISFVILAWCFKLSSHTPVEGSMCLCSWIVIKYPITSWQQNSMASTWLVFVTLVKWYARLSSFPSVILYKYLESPQHDNCFGCSHKNF